MRTMELLGVEPGVVTVGIVKRKETVLDIVFAEGDRIAIDLGLVEIDFLFAGVFLLVLLEITVA